MSVEATRFCFLLYMSRSGSTMLANQISRRMPDVLVFPELDLVGNLHGMGDAAVSELSAAALTRRLTADPKHTDLGLDAATWSVIGVAAAGGGVNDVLIEIAGAFAETLGRAKPRVVLFQRGTLMSLAPEVLRRDAQARCLHIFRDPRAAISSIIKVTRSDLGRYDGKAMGRSDASGLGRNWRLYMESARRLNTVAPERVLEIAYETLCQDNEAVLDQVARHFGVMLAPANELGGGLQIDPEQSELHQNINRAPIKARIDAWRTEMSVRDGFLVECNAGAELTRRGYSLVYTPRMGAFDRALLRQFGHAQRAVCGVRPLLKRLRQLALEPGSELGRGRWR